MSKKNRDSNIELLRIILMLMIVMHHLIVHGCGLSLLSVGELPPVQNTVVFLFVNSFLIVAVNAYIFISAYYGVKFSLKGLVSFIVQATFYSSVIYIIACFTGWDAWSLPNFYRSLIPIISAKWWFLTGYVLLFILSPMLNAGLEAINKRQHLFIMLALIIFSASFYLTNFNVDSQRVNVTTLGLFLTMYVCGRYVRKYSISVKRPLVMYILLSVFIFGIVFFYYKSISYQSAWNIYGYTNPIIILSAICLFFTFKNFSLNNSFINKISVLTLGVYLIHDADPTRRFLVSLMQGFQTQNTVLLLLIILGFGIVIFTVCACIEKCRQIVFTPLVDRIMSTEIMKKINL